MDTPTWIQAIERLRRSTQRVDPFDPEKTRLKYWNQTDLAEAAGVRPNTLSEILGGKREPSITTLMKLAEAFGVPLSTFFISERQASLLDDQRAHDALMERQTNLRDEVRQMVAEALTPQIDRLTEAAMAKLVPAPAPSPTKTKHLRKRSV